MVKSKIKLRVDPRVEIREFDGKLTVNEVREIVWEDGQPLPDMEEMSQAMDGADWSTDPGTGRAILLEDGRELLNPIPVAPPSSILAAAAEPSVNDLVERALKRHYEQLKAADEIDSLADADDFPEDEDWHPGSMFEVVLRDEAPAVPKEPVSEEAVADVKKLEEEVTPPVVEKGGQ